jgi:type I restriction enzyme M protein
MASVKAQTFAKGKIYKTPQALNGAIKSICDVMRRSNCAGALQYIPELTWILFLRILDQQETIEVRKASALSVKFTYTLASPYRWSDWAAPSGCKRIQLQMSGIGAFFNFVNDDLIPYLKTLKYHPQATPRQRVISEIMSSVERVRIDTELNFLDVLDKVHEISTGNIDQTHIFPLSQVYEGLLLKMGEKSNDGGQYFTPREIIRAMVSAIAPQIGETVYDPCCGTGGFLAQAYEFMSESVGVLRAEQIETLKRHTFYGREKDNLIYPIALANLMLHGIDEPHLWYGNTLTGQIAYDGLFQGAPELFDVILTNPPFGGKEGQEVQSSFAFKTGSTQVLFLQHIINSLKPGGRCAIVLDEGVLFRTSETAFVQTKRKLLEECNLWCIVSLPVGVFVNAGTSLKTNILFFTKGKPTENIWYYDLSSLKVGKKNPLTMENFKEFFRLLQSKSSSDMSWSVSCQTIVKNGYDLKAVNPNFACKNDSYTKEELLKLIEAKGREVVEALATLREAQK